jgi:hypothetical protein
MLTVDDAQLCCEMRLHRISLQQYVRGTLMTKNRRLLILPALLIAFRCSSVSAASPGDCLPYEPNSVQLTGRIVRKVFPGPPNYESVKEGDKPEGAYILHLAKPICVRSEKEDEDNAAEDGVSDLHLVLRGNQFRQLRGL